MSKKLIIVLTVGILLLGATVALYMMPIFSKKPKVNPDIFPIFRKIEKHCFNYIQQDSVDPQEYERCKKVVDLHRQASNSEFYYAEEYYKNLERLGFKMPSLYRDE